MATTIQTDLLLPRDPTTALMASTKQYVDARNNVAVTSVSANYTLVLTDNNKAIESTSATAITVTIPPNSSVAFAVGAVVEIAQIGAGQVTIAAGAGVTLRTSSSLTTRAQYSALSIRQRATDDWILSGDMT